MDPDPRENDPDFLLCVALTYIGLPPGVWRIVVSEFLEAVSQEYRARHGEQRAPREFERWKTEYTAWSNFNKFKTLIVFLAESKVGIITISHPAALAIRTRVLTFLAERGVQAAVVQGASQIVRKVAIFLEIAYISGCAAYCGGIAAANAMTEFARAAGEAINTFGQIARALGSAITQAIVRPILVGRAMLDPSNWDTSPLGSSALALQLMGNALWSHLHPNDPNAFLAALSRPISEHNVPRPVIDEIAASMTRVVNARGGIQQAVNFPADLILGLTPLAFVQLLRDWSLIRFVRSPEQIADATP